MFEGQRIEFIVMAKGDNRFDQFPVVPKILIAEFRKPILLSVRPEALTNIPVIDRVSRWVVPTTEFAGEGEVLLHAGAIGDEKNGVEGTVVEKLIEMLVVCKPDDVLGNGFNINVSDHCGVELIEYQNL